jgi:hypothetical protein
MAIDPTTFAASLKSYYGTKDFTDLTKRRNAFLKLVKKNTKFGGADWPLPIIGELPGGGSATIATAITNATDGEYDRFLLTRKKDYQIVNIDGEVIAASKDKETAFMDAKKVIDLGIDAANNTLADQLFALNGSKGRVSSTSTLSSTVLVLQDRLDVTGFQVGMVLKVSADASGGSLRTGTLTVASIQRAAGTVTMTAALNSGVSAIAAGDHIFREGDYGSVLSGVPAWIPDEDPSATTFFGVDRSTNPSRYAGHRLDASGMSVDQALNEMAYEILDAGGEPTHVFVNPKKLGELANQLGSQVVRDDSGKADIGFDGFRIRTDGGSLMVVGDSNVKLSRGYMLQLDTWVLGSAGGGAVRVLDLDGMFKRSATADAYEVRIGGYRQLGCENPSANGVIKFSA